MNWSGAGVDEPVLDAVPAADLVEAADARASGPSVTVAWQVGERQYLLPPNIVVNRISTSND